MLSTLSIIGSEKLMFMLFYNMFLIACGIFVMPPPLLEYTTALEKRLNLKRIQVQSLNGSGFVRKTLPPSQAGYCCLNHICH